MPTSIVVGIALVLCAPATFSATPSPSPTAAQDFSNVALQLTSDRAVYVPGQLIFLMTELVKHGRGDVRYVTTHRLFRDMDLTVLDASGRRLAPNTDREPFDGSVGPTSLVHDESRVDGATLTSWGYALQPGTYDIFGTLGAVTSNRISIRITAPVLVESVPRPAGLSDCIDDFSVDYRSVFPTDLKNVVSPDIGAIAFSVPFGLDSARLTLKPDNQKAPAVEVIATSVEQPSRNAAILRALLPPLHERTRYTIDIEAPLTYCKGDYNGILGVLRTGARPTVGPSPSGSLVTPVPLRAVPEASPSATSFQSSVRMAEREVGDFDKSHDPTRLQSADAILLRSAAYTLDGATNLERRRTLVRAWIHLFEVIDANIDPTFDVRDPSQLPFISISPPRERSGRQMFSGADPRDVQDPVARSTYEAELRANDKKAQRVNYQVALRRFDESSIHSLWIALTNYRPFTPPDTVVLTAMIESSGLSPQRVAKLIPLI